jgi:predicted esterase
VAKIPGIDARRPVLMGYSAGGQMALSLWRGEPKRFGGLILDATYPVRRTATGFAPIPLPDDEAIQKTPVFVLVGGNDGGSKLWRDAAPRWREAAVPLTLRVIPGKGHTWLVGAAQIDEIVQWLKGLAAGKLPADPAPF